MIGGLLGFSLKHLRSRLSRTLLTLFSVTIGVAAIAAVEMTAEATRDVYKEMFATVTGRAELEVKAGANKAFDRTVLDAVRAVPGVQAAAPTISGLVQFNASQEGDSTDDAGGESPTETDEESIAAAKAKRVRKTKIFLMGVDPTVDTAVRTISYVEGRAPTDEWDVVIDQDVARALKVKVGSTVRVLCKLGSLSDGLPTLKVVGLSRTTQAGQAAQGGLALVNLRTAQWLLLSSDPDDADPVDQIKSIQIVPAKGITVESLQKRIAAVLPEGFSCGAPTIRTKAFEATMEGTQQGLHVTTRFGLLLGAFIIFNTLLMNVSERRRQIAVVRALGATRGQIQMMILKESVVFGLIGVAIGLGLGWLGARAITEILARAMEVNIPPARMTWTIAATAGVFGFGMTVLGAIVPAWTAAKLSPQEAMSATTQSSATSESAIRQTMWGLAMAAAGGGLLSLCIYKVLPMKVAVYGGMAIVLSALLLLHNLMYPLSAIASAALEPFLGVTARLAHRQLMRNRTRTSITAGVLFIACATGVSMAHTILDSVADVRNWYERVLTGDFFVRAMIPDARTGESSSVPGTLPDEVRTLPGIKAVDTALFMPIDSLRPATAETFDGDPTAKDQVTVIARELPPGVDLKLDVVPAPGESKPMGDKELRDRLVDAGEIAIGSVYAKQSGLRPGDSVTLVASTGPATLRIAAVVNDYIAGGLTVWMSRKTAKEILGADETSAIIVYAEEGRRDEVEKSLQTICSKYQIAIHSFRNVKDLIEGMIKGTDSCLWSMIVLGFVVAAFGMVNTLTMNVIEQTREIGMLRTVAMTRGQVRQAILAQAVTMALIGLIPGIAAGMGTTYLLNQAAQVSMGHDIAYMHRPMLAVWTFLGALVLMLIAAYFPARRASQLAISEALRCD